MSTLFSFWPNLFAPPAIFWPETVCWNRGETLKIESDMLKKSERFFHERIPLTRAMGLRVVADSAHGFAVEAPVDLNHNHLATAFGGSINSVATLAGYALLWLELQEASAQIVIGSSSIRFLRPVRETIRAVCLRPEDSALENFKTALRENGKARIALTVYVIESGAIAAQFDATFVASTSEEKR